MIFQEVFNTVTELMKDADVSTIEGKLAFQFNITGEEGGTFYAEVKDKQLSIEPYDYHDRDALFIAKPEVFLAILSGKQDPVVAFTLGKLKIEGSLEKALLLKSIIKGK